MKSVYCRHIRPNGDRCCAFAIRGNTHYYFHSQLNTRHGRLARRAQAEEPAILTPLTTDPANLASPSPHPC